MVVPHGDVIVMKEQTSVELFERARRVIPGGVNSPVRAFRSVGGTPLFMTHGEGCRIRDADANEYIDFVNSWGPLILGHRPPRVVAALQAQIAHALTFGTPCEQEVMLAEYAIERIRPSVPSVECMRFVSSGTEAVMSALRLARWHTGRSKIVKFEGCYHGHVDSLLVKAGSGLATAGVPDSAGVPHSFTADTIVLPLDDDAALLDCFAREGAQIAAVIVEPVPANNGLLIQRPEFLELLARLCRENSSLLILDEVISGFRVGFAGASGHYRLQPDLVTYGKIIGGGLPVGAFAGRKIIFESLAPDGPVYQAGTLSGNPMAMTAGLAQLQLLDPEVYRRLEELGSYLQEQFDRLKTGWGMVRLHSIFWLFQGDHAPRRADQISRESMAVYARLHRHALASGIHLAPSGYEVGFLSAPMSTVEVDCLIECLARFFEKERSSQR